MSFKTDLEIILTTDGRGKDVKRKALQRITIKWCVVVSLIWATLLALLL